MLRDIKLLAKIFNLREPFGKRLLNIPSVHWCELLAGTPHFFAAQLKYTFGRRASNLI
jgi:hypothetical protein